MKTTKFKIIFTSVLLSVVFMGKSFANINTTESNTDSSNKYSKLSNPTNDDRRKIRLGFTAPSTMNRQLLLTEDENATSGIDWGYDGAYYATQYDDMYWLIEGQLFTIQGTNVVDETSNFPLGFHINESGMSTIRIDELENISDDFSLHLYDNVLEVYHNLRDSDYEFYAEAGEYLDRFDLVFDESVESSGSLSIDENKLDNFKIYYNSTSNTLTLDNPSNAVLKGLSIYNITGQLIINQSLHEFSSKQDIQFNNQYAKGTYIVLIETEFGAISKKILLH